MTRRSLFGSITIVGVAAATAFLAVEPRAQRAGAAAPTLAVVNGKVFTGEGSFREAVAVAGNRIVRVGTSEEIMALRTPATQVVDARGRAVVPGFIDSHVHFMLGGESLEQLNLRGTRTREEARDRVKAFVASHPGRGWIKGANGYGRLTGADLDELIPDRAAFIVSGDVHSLLANAKARAAAGITKSTPDPPNGKIVRDEATGEPNGLMLESAQGLIT